jgi:chromosome segregation ATPase
MTAPYNLNKGEIMLTSAEAKSLGGIARQVRALLVGIDKLPDAFDQVEGLEVQLAAAKKEKLAVEADTAALKATLTQLNEDYRRLQAQYAGLNAEYRTRKDRLESGLSTLLTDVAEAEQRKLEIEAQLASLKAKLA